MNSLEKDLVPYERALALRKLGFNEPCFMQWTYAPDLIPCICDWGKLKPKTNQESYYDSLGECISAPTFSQAFRWFRKKYKIHSIINLTIIGTWYFELYDLNDKRNAEIKTNQNEFETPEEAELACLIKLIEIVKNK